MPESCAVQDHQFENGTETPCAPRVPCMQDGWTALMIAARRGHKAVVRELIGPRPYGHSEQGACMPDTMLMALPYVWHGFGVLFYFDV